ncbi:MAG TPA: hypothetical protein VNF27_07985 [Candidatus Binataceae bacterium]|nr:hypothetical protein [Candidatus Binataceae bacterium]
MKRSIMAGVLALAMLAMAGCAGQGQEQSQSQWLGKSRSDLSAAMGEPKSAVPLPDTGGEMMFYSYQGHHYVFETGADGKIEKAVEVR